MNKKLKDKILTNKQIEFLAFHTCQWLNMLSVQTKRFFAAFDSDKSLPFLFTANECFFPERIFLIMAISHTLENLQKLAIELEREGDTFLRDVITDIDKKYSIERIKDLRDMNEHFLDYISGTGLKPQKYMETSPHRTLCNGEKNLFLFGNVEVIELLKTMREYRNAIKSKLYEIFTLNGIDKPITPEQKQNIIADLRKKLQISANNGNLDT